MLLLASFEIKHEILNKFLCISLLSFSYRNKQNGLNPNTHKKTQEILLFPSQYSHDISQKDTTKDLEIFRNRGAAWRGRNPQRLGRGTSCKKLSYDFKRFCPLCPMPSCFSGFPK